MTTKSIHGAKMLAHRAAWALKNGVIPKGLDVCHHCDNPACVRPSHLFIGTVTDNMLDCSKKGRHKGSNGKCRGEKNKNAKLNDKKIRAIRKRKEPASALTDEYGVSISLINAVRRREVWRHVK